MEIVIQYPPLIEEIHRKFNVLGKPIIYAWGHKIYNPQNIYITPELMAHETVHSLQQGTALHEIESWWRRYIDDPEFRLDQETPAHMAEYRRYCEETKDRNRRAVMLTIIASKLASPLYGGLISTKAARTAIMTPR
jgi:hypothetical protein